VPLEFRLEVYDVIERKNITLPAPVTQYGGLLTPPREWCAREQQNTPLPRCAKAHKRSRTLDDSRLCNKVNKLT
jgi:hypothetical protein